MSFSPGFMTANDGGEEEEKQASSDGGLGEGFHAIQFSGPRGYFKTEGRNG